MSVTIALVIITTIVSFLAFRSGPLMSKLIFDAYVIKYRNHWYRFVTSGFIHADFFHLLINMLVLYSFGLAVEQYYIEVFEYFGRYYFFMMYFSALIVSSVPSYYKYNEYPGFNSLGASGAVSAVVFAAILFNPMAKIYIWGLLGIPGLFLGLAYIVYSIYMANKGKDLINHDAHLYGAIFGFIYTGVLNTSLFSRFWEQITFYFSS